MNVLEISGLEKRFGEKQVLRGVNLIVPEKKVFGFVGRNGAGKTTTMKIIIIIGAFLNWDPMNFIFFLRIVYRSCRNKKNRKRKKYCCDR